MAYKLEIAGDRNDRDYIEVNAKDAISAYEGLVSALQPITIGDKKEVKNKGDISPEDVPMIFKHLSEYVSQFNDEALGSMIGALKGYIFPGQSQHIFDELCQAHEAGDWGRMQSITEGKL